MVYCCLLGPWQQDDSELLVLDFYKSWLQVTSYYAVILSSPLCNSCGYLKTPMNLVFWKSKNPRTAGSSFLGGIGKKQWVSGWACFWYFFGVFFFFSPQVMVVICQKWFSDLLITAVMKWKNLPDTHCSVNLLWVFVCKAKFVIFILLQKGNWT